MAKESKTSLRPLDDRIIVEPLEADEKTAGGILLPDSAQEKPQRGKIIAVGPGQLMENGNRSAMSVAVGDIVLYGKYSGTDLEFNQNEIKIMRESDVLAKLKK